MTGVTALDYLTVRRCGACFYRLSEGESRRFMVVFIVSWIMCPNVATPMIGALIAPPAD